MAKLLVAGGIYEQEEAGPVRKVFAQALGRQIILRGHTLLGGCRTTLDLVVAEAASKAAQAQKQDPRRVIRSWVTKSTKPIHMFGEITRSKLGDWALIPRGYAFPEPVLEADAMMIVGGWDGTHHAASWGRIAGKPVLPVATFGGAAADIYDDELLAFDRRGVVKIPREDFESLNRILADQSESAIEQYAIELIKLAERAILSSDVFVVMSFEDKPHLRDAYIQAGLFRKKLCRGQGRSASRQSRAHRSRDFLQYQASGFRDCGN